MGHQAERARPHQTHRGRRTDGEVLVFTRTRPSRDHPATPVSTHFTGGEARRLPHLTATSLWERVKEGNEEQHGGGRRGGILFFPKYLSHHKMHPVITPQTLT